MPESSRAWHCKVCQTPYAQPNKVYLNENMENPRGFCVKCNKNQDFYRREVKRDAPKGNKTGFFI